MSRLSSVIVLFVFLSAKSFGQIVVNESLTIENNTSDHVYPRSWFSDLFDRALANFTVTYSNNDVCRNQIKLYEENLRNYTDWAVRMSESWDRRPIGILSGNKYHMGNYDECVNVHYPIRGQYCLSEVNITVAMENRTNRIGNYSDNNAWYKILKWINHPSQIQRNSLNLGICIPDSCSASDLQTSLQFELNKVFLLENVKAVVIVDPIMCTVSGDMYPRDKSFYITSGVLGFLLFICIYSTLNHYKILSNQHNKTIEVPKLILHSFSLIRSMQELLKFDKNNELNLINGAKVIMMVSVLLGHKLMYLLGNPISEPLIIENIYISGPDILITCMNMADPFFYITGFLLYITIFPTFKKTGSAFVQITLPIIYRIAKFLPAYCVMMAIMAHIVPHLGSGPLWPQNVWNEAEQCKKHWWTNMLFISNFIDVKNQCLIISWYVSCDIQFVIVGTILLYVYKKNEKFGIALLSFILGLSLIVPFIFTLLTENDGLLKVDIGLLINPRGSKTFNESYRPSYMRAIPFIIGLIMGIIIQKLKDMRIKFSQMTVYGGTFFITTFCLWIQTYGSVFYKRDRPYYPLEHALYATVSHCTWTVICAWSSVMYFTTGFGSLTKLFNNKLVVPMGRLSYSVFLVNLVLMLVNQSLQRTPLYMSTKTLLDSWMYDAIISYIIALPLYLIVESPFGNIMRNLFGRGFKKNVSNTNEKCTTLETEKMISLIEKNSHV